MNNHQRAWIIAISLVVILGIAIGFTVNHIFFGEDSSVEEPNGNDNGDENGDENGNGDGNGDGNGNGDNDGNGNGDSNGNGNDEDPEYFWGLDSADIVNEDFYGCIREHYGEPAAFGRYLETIDGVSHGLSAEEVEFLHEHDIQIIPIYNHFTDGTTYDKGVEEAETAIAFAEDLGIPEDIYIFANVEPEYPIDADFLQGWIDTLLPSIYKPGVYGIFDAESDLAAAYEVIVQENDDIEEEVAIWHSSSPYIGVTPKDEAPDFEPEVPDHVQVSIWQYGIDGEDCNIDTNLIDSSIFDFLW